MSIQGSEKIKNNMDETGFWSVIDGLADKSDLCTYVKSVSGYFSAIVTEKWRQRTQSISEGCQHVIEDLSNGKSCDRDLTGYASAMVVAGLYGNEAALELRKARIEISSEIRDLLNVYDLDVLKPDLDEITDLLVSPRSFRELTFLEGTLNSKREELYLENVRSGILPLPA